MFRLTLTKRLAHASAHVTQPPHPRLFSTSYSLFNKGPPTTQGHTLGKSNGDPQAEAAKQGAAAKGASSSSSTSTSGEAEPFDAARQAGGEAKWSKSQETSGVGKGQSGAFKDQVGGQEGSTPGVSYGGQEDAAADRTHQGIKNTQPGSNKGNFDNLKKMREEGKNFHTSARASFPAPSSVPYAPTSANPPGSNKPIESLPSDQNEHLRHSPASSPDKGKGNAGEEPHLPSQQGQNKAGGNKGQTKALHTSTKASGNPPGGKYAKALPGDRSGGGAPAEALPPDLESDYGPEANQPAPENLKPSSGLPHSSTAEEPPHPVLTDHAKSGKLAERNSQPTAEMGRQGNSEAWKHRK
ncbi:hypothetical protein J008_04744 [Cryptococcus neoformans]|uniref:Uncharacterized protein n=2 Tax=Cryptococcus neoformans TaxID=5207 RepID=A0A854QEN1_CRYNE|nr:hypothetical protein CNAG_04106 [Cryptococcus neoformans var. grubii H99]AUB26798.1 hypothetical protein CKF44_04106 [Cryptococcus neoformans var. grubii]OWT37264.1 hypothetical protein C362_04272 [Cryptococcus neoformans var. grubii Bt1]OWZ29144.1 hypothetical protein C347_05010 [Cryptococcus neoformans var. grubii AD2-60a]OWZ36252.1 hypothetical protein C353_04861 [Cryptococcus neoformans var. grubii AD1-83a]OWZ41010.1 hypothetical protein C343_04964 [Cryptococcus neoformans var. grubii C|eukprot:XP_012051590.1 hypothetical protein CNAG_04106 [Cryptococcus neoformans var. grubii H99]